MINCTCAMRGPETCPRHRAYEQRSMAGLDPMTARVLAPSSLPALEWPEASRHDPPLARLTDDQP